MEYLPGTEGVFEPDPVDPTGEGMCRSAERPGCWGPGVVGVGVARELDIILLLLFSEFASSMLPGFVASYNKKGSKV